MSFALSLRNSNYCNDILKFIETFLIIKGIRSYYLNTTENNDNINTNNPQNQNSNSNVKIILSTIHGTKGLEFDHEIFIDFIPDRCTNQNELEEINLKTNNF